MVRPKKQKTFLVFQTDLANLLFTVVEEKLKWQNLALPFFLLEGMTIYYYTLGYLDLQKYSIFSGPMLPGKLF